MVNTGSIPVGPSHGEVCLLIHSGDVLTSGPTTQGILRSGKNLEGMAEQSTEFIGSNDKMLFCSNTSGFAHEVSKLSRSQLPKIFSDMSLYMSKRAYLFASVVYIFIYVMPNCLPTVGYCTASCVLFLPPFRSALVVSNQRPAALRPPSLPGRLSCQNARGMPGLSLLLMHQSGQLGRADRDG